MTFRRFSLFSFLALGASFVSAHASSKPGTQDGCDWSVPGVGTFNTHFSIDWTVTPGQTSQELSASTYTAIAGDTSRALRFDMVNVGFDQEALTLTVPGGQGASKVSSAQLITSHNDVLYGSIRTVAMVSDVSGSTHGFSMHSDDDQEINLSFLTRDLSNIHLTNGQAAIGSPMSPYTYPAPDDAATAWHEYRVDWMPDHTAFFIDGESVLNITDGVPRQPGYWIWNNWSNRNTWTLDPPQQDAVLRIRSIDAYYNRVAVAAVAGTDSNYCGNSVELSSSSDSTSVAASAPSSKLVVHLATSSASSTTVVTPRTFVTSTKPATTPSLIVPLIPFSAFTSATPS